VGENLKGTFITFEGSEGSGKSTQARMVHDYLKKEKKPVLFIREPGGVKISESIRNILLDVQNDDMTNECEMLLYMAARAQLVKEVISPALKKGKIVLCDRFLDSTVVYQGFGNGLDIDMIKKVGDLATQGITPELTFVFDIDAEKGLSRTGKVKDRIELRSLSYHERVRKGYQQIAKQEPKRIKLIKVNKGKEEIQEIIQGYIKKLIG